MSNQANDYQSTKTRAKIFKRERKNRDIAVEISQQQQYNSIQQPQNSQMRIVNEVPSQNKIEQTDFIAFQEEDIITQQLNTENRTYQYSYGKQKFKAAKLIKNQMYLNKEQEERGFDFNYSQKNSMKYEKKQQQQEIPFDKHEIKLQNNDKSNDYSTVSQYKKKQQISSIKKRRQKRQVLGAEQKQQQIQQKKIQITEQTIKQTKKNVGNNLKQQNAKQTVQKNIPQQYHKSTTIQSIPALIQSMEMKDFLMKPLPTGIVMQCFLRKYSQKFSTKFQLFLDDLRPLMAAEAQSGTIGCNYHISINKEMSKDSEFYLGKVRSNFTGSSYSVYGAGQNPKSTSDKKKWRETVANIQYEANFMGIKGPRKLSVQIPNPTVNIPADFFKIDEKITLEQLTEKNPNCLRRFKNKDPRWNEKLKSYALNFGGRVKMASIKNFILQDIISPDKNLLVFGKVDQRTFSLDVWYPFTPFQAMGIILTCFDYKLTCQ